MGYSKKILILGLLSATVLISSARQLAETEAIKPDDHGYGHEHEGGGRHYPPGIKESVKAVIPNDHYQGGEGGERGEYGEYGGERGEHGEYGGEREEHGEYRGERGEHGEYGGEREEHGEYGGEHGEYGGKREEHGGERGEHGEHGGERGEHGDHGHGGYYPPGIKGGMKTMVPNDHGHGREGHQEGGHRHPPEEKAKGVEPQDQGHGGHS